MPNSDEQEQEEEEEGEEGEEGEEEKEKGAARELAEEKGKEMAKEAVKKAAKEAIKKVAKKVGAAVLKATAKALVALGALLVKTFPIWGPVVLAILVIVIILVSLMGGGESVCSELAQLKADPDNLTLYEEIKNEYTAQGTDIEFVCGLKPGTTKTPTGQIIVSPEVSGAAPGAAEEIFKKSYGIPGGVLME